MVTFARAKWEAINVVRGVLGGAVDQAACISVGTCKAAVSFGALPFLTCFEALDCVFKLWTVPCCSSVGALLLFARCNICNYISIFCNFKSADRYAIMRMDNRQQIY